MLVLKDVNKNLYYDLKPRKPTTSVVGVCQTAGRYIGNSKNDTYWSADINNAKVYKEVRHAQSAAKKFVNPGYGRRKRQIAIVKIIFEPREVVEMLTL